MGNTMKWDWESEMKNPFNGILFNILKNAFILNSSKNMHMHKGFISDLQPIQENIICCAASSGTSTSSSSWQMRILEALLVQELIISTD